MTEDETQFLQFIRAALRTYEEPGGLGQMVRTDEAILATFNDKRYRITVTTQPTGD